MIGLEACSRPAMYGANCQGAKLSSALSYSCHAERPAPGPPRPRQIFINLTGFVLNYSDIPPWWIWG